MDKVGKKFEQKFKEDWENCFGRNTVDRLYDSVSGYKAISNICDFIGFCKPCIYYLECKTHKGHLFPITSKDKKTGKDKPFRQYEKLSKKVGIPGVRTGVIIWYYELDKVWYVPIATITKMMKDGKKSIDVNKDMEKYRIIEVPSIKKQVYMNSDYTILTSLNDGD